MPNIDDFYQSGLLKADDIPPGKTPRVQVSDFSVEDLGEGERKPAISFRGHDKKMILNRTNAETLKTAFGSDTDHWLGKEVELYVDRVLFQGRHVPALRIRIPTPPPAAGEPDLDVPW